MLVLLALVTSVTAQTYRGSVRGKVYDQNGAGIPAATVFAYPAGMQSYTEALPVLAMVIVPALLMVSTIRFQSFKAFDLQARRSYPAVLIIALALALLVSHPQLVLIVMAYAYLASTLVAFAWSKLRRRSAEHDADTAAAGPEGAKNTKDLRVR